MNSAFSGKKVLVVGNGISASGAIFALNKLGASVTVYTDESLSSFPDKDYDLIVISPGVSKSHFIYDYAARMGTEIIGEIELGARINDKSVVAVTGTNGKTTTVRMIEKLLNSKYKAVACGNIGVSFAKTAICGGYDVAIVEVSSFQLESISLFRPDVAVITNIGEDHLNRHGSVEEYARLKKKIAQNQTEKDLIVLSQDNISTSMLIDFNPQSRVVFQCTRGKINGAYVRAGAVYYFDQKVIDTDKLPFTGVHNYANFLNAVVVAKHFGVSNQEIELAIADFTCDEHRISFVKAVNGVNFFDDSKATNVSATLCALDVMQGSTCLIAGGSDKNCSFDLLFRKCVDLPVKVNIIGQTREKMKASAFISGFSNVQAFDSLEEAVIDAYSSGCKNVLLSPAAASFDAFKSYEERGNRFKEIVNALK